MKESNQGFNPLCYLNHAQPQITRCEWFPGDSNYTLKPKDERPKKAKQFERFLRKVNLAARILVMHPTCRIIISAFCSPGFSQISAASILYVVRLGVVTTAGLFL